MNVLIACEESQVVCKAFRAAGYNAFSCDIQDCSGGHPEWHIKGDVSAYLNPNIAYGDPYFNVPFESGIQFYTVNGDYHFIDTKWDLIIAHPPCTYLSRVSAPRLYVSPGVIDPERYKEVEKASDFFFKCLNADCEHIAVENPVPMKICNLPKPSCMIQPYHFGDRYTKKHIYG